MATFRATKTIAATSDSIWGVLARYGSIAAFSPHIAHSAILSGESEAGVEAFRKCDLSDSRNHVKERVTEWDEGVSRTVDIYKVTMPTRDAYAKESVKAKPRAGAASV